MTSTQDEESLYFDVVIVGAGPAGLTAAIRLKDLCQRHGQELSVCVLEKGSQVGAHILSGAVLDPKSLFELMPDALEKGAPLTLPVKEDHFSYLTRQKKIALPTPPSMKNHGCYIVRLSQVCAWLGEQAEERGVEIFPGFAAFEAIIQDHRVVGVRTSERGRNKQGEKTEAYEPGVALYGRHVILAEGCRGSLTEKIIKTFDLRAHACPQTYGIGLKEIWEVNSTDYQEGRVEHTIGWPLDAKTYGGGFLYHLDQNQVALGFVAGLDYENPTFSPFETFQQMKHHPSIASRLKGGKRLSYGARALNEGGYQSIPNVAFPGGSLVGCGAGFMNVPRIKGTHTAMKSALLAADVVFEDLALKKKPTPYPVALKESWLWKELYQVRNIRPGFRWGLWMGLVNAALETYVLKGKGPWTLSHQEDHRTLRPHKEVTPFVYPKPDGVLSFDRLSSVYLTNTYHDEDQPSHLKLRDPKLAITYNWKVFKSPEQYYCPAGVYEIIQEQDGPKLQINAQNCIHCKTCDIKDPAQNIQWVPPEGGGGPTYTGM